MAKPIFSYNSSYAFDATKEHVFNFMWSNTNNQAVANTLEIRNNETNVVVYSQTQNTLLLQHTLQPNTLTNGILYNAYLTVTDINGTVSGKSDAILFYCYTTPTLTVDVDNVIQTSSCSIGVNYSQPENEELQVFKIELYNSSKELLYTSSLKYSITSTVQFNGLVDNTTYYVKAIGQTINHMDVESDYIMFTVNYISPDFYAYITAENRYNYGDIQFTSNLVSIEGSTIDGSEAVYINNEYIDTVNGSGIKFDENFNINNDFRLIMSGYNLIPGQPFLILSNLHSYIYLYSRLDETNNHYIELNVIENNEKKIINFSNKLMVSQQDLIHITLTHKNGYFNIEIRRD